MEDLARIALVGTSRHPQAAPDAEHPAESLVAALATDDREQAFLLRAGARALFEQCGRPLGEKREPPAPAPPESRPFAPPQLAGLLQNAMASSAWEMLAEFLGEMDAAGLLLPPEILPQALGVTDADARQRLLPVLGERGRWLSEFNPEWRWVRAGVGDLSDRDRSVVVRRWEEGGFSERCRALETLRRGDAAEARKLLESAIDQEKPDHRARLLETLAIQLGADDEPLLDGRLGDRAEQVRAVAARLLARLPGSALAQRMRARAEAMLTEKAGKGKSLHLACQPPEEIDKDWVRDGVPAKPPQGRGKRAVWTEAVLSAVPPSVWSARFSAAPRDLMEAIGSDQFAASVLVGWTQAAAAFAPDDPASAAWVRPLWDHWADGTPRRGAAARAEVAEHLQCLLQAMPADEADRAMGPLLMRALEADRADVLGLLGCLTRPWSDAFSRSYLETVRKAIARPADNTAYQWAQSLLTAAQAIPRSAFAAALEEWHAAKPGKTPWFSQGIAREIENFTETIRTRQRFYEAVAGRGG